MMQYLKQYKLMYEKKYTTLSTGYYEDYILQKMKVKKDESRGNNHEMLPKKR